MPERYFTREDVERLIPRLASVMERVRAAHATAGEAREALALEERRITLTGGGVVDQAGWRARRETIERCTQQVQAGLAEIQRLGGVTKDLELGLVDFLHLREGREVNLCWKLGEPRITHWHGMDEGYARRKPL